MKYLDALMNLKGSQLLKTAARKSQPSADAKKILNMAGASMRAYFVVWKTNGKTHATTPEKFYGFQAADVLEMYFHKRGFGNGLCAGCGSPLRFQMIQSPGRAGGNSGLSASLPTASFAQ